MQNINSDTPSKSKKIVVKNAALINDMGRVTTTNFGGNLNQKITSGKVDEAQPEELEDLNESMITWNISPDEWNLEVKRVEKDLMQFYSKLDQEQTDPINDWLTQAKNTSSWLTREAENSLSKAIDVLTSDLFYISKEEVRMNKNYSTDIGKLEGRLF